MGRHSGLLHGAMMVFLLKARKGWSEPEHGVSQADGKSFCVA